MTDINLTTLKHVHFIGVGGVGMGGIAEILLKKGVRVSGSDVSANEVTERLAKLGADVHIQHAASHVEGAEMVVMSSAIQPDNPELVAAKAHDIPIVLRAQMLGALMSEQQGIAIAGTHGKTTTTGFVTQCLQAGGLSPSFVVGGIMRSSGRLSQLGAGEYLVAEADESDASFLYLSPKFAVVTNIDADHLETYADDFSKLKRTFVDFLHRLPEDGLAILCGDDPVVRSLLSDIHRPKIVYGFSEACDVQALNYQQNGLVSTFQIRHGDTVLAHTFTLPQPGRHNVQNALSAYILADALGVPAETIAAGLAAFAGMGRRFHICGELDVGPGPLVTIVDDYGHHPREIDVTLKAMRAVWPARRLVLAFQPHRYSRTKALMHDFIKVLADADKLLLLPIYSAGEAPLPGVSSRELCNPVAEHAQASPLFIEHIDRLPTALRPVLQAGDVLLMQGAGDITHMAHQLAASGLAV